MKFKVTQIKPLNVLHFQFKNQIDLTLSFLRMQEFYESPKFRNKLFTLDQYIAWYCNTEKSPKAFDYVTEVAGHNIPGNWFRKWEDLVGDDRMSIREWAIVDEVRKRYEGEDFYLIGTTEDLPDLKGYIAHELRHAMFYLIPGYRDAILKVIKQFKLKKFRKELRGKDGEGYNPAVINDEIQAYALTGFAPYYDCKISDLPKELQRLRKELKKVERQYIKKGKVHVPG